MYWLSNNVPHRHPRPVTGIALLFFFCAVFSVCVCNVSFIVCVLRVLCFVWALCVILCVVFHCSTIAMGKNPFVVQLHNNNNIYMCYKHLSNYYGRETSFIVYVFCFHNVIKINVGVMSSLWFACFISDLINFVLDVYPQFSQRKIWFWFMHMQYNILFTKKIDNFPKNV
jgi:hypothetical protein